MAKLASGVTTGVEEGAQREITKVGPMVQNTPAPASYATAGNQTYTTDDIIGTIIVRDPAGGDRTDVLPTAALLVAAIPHAKIGDTVDCLIINGGATNKITLTAGTGGALDTNQAAASAAIATLTSKYISIRITNVSTPAYVFYC